MTGTGTLTLSGASNYTGNVTLSGGVVSLAPASGSTATYSGVISGAGALQENGQGTAVITGANPGFTGAATINQGQLTINNVRRLAPQQRGDDQRRAGQPQRRRRHGQQAVYAQQRRHLERDGGKRRATAARSIAPVRPRFAVPAGR